MDIDTVIRDFATTDSTLPRTSMRWALDHWDAAAPRFIDLLERYAEGVDRDDDTAAALFFVIHLLGERREARAFPALCKLLADADASEGALGEAITETLNGILINTYNGDPAVLKAVIEAESADEFVRCSALEAMAYLTRDGAIPEDEMRAYLQQLLSELKPQGESFLWSGWAMSAANLGYADYAGTVETLIRRKFIADQDMSLGSFREQLRLTLDDPQRLEGFMRDHIEPFGEAIGTLSTWYGFSEAFKKDRARAAGDEEEPEAVWGTPGETYVNPLRHVGRNDPCPCGSGKKFKKCCLQ